MGSNNGPWPSTNRTFTPRASNINRISANRIAASNPNLSMGWKVTSVARSEL